MKDFCTSSLINELKLGFILMAISDIFKLGKGNKLTK